MNEGRKSSTKRQIYKKGKVEGLQKGFLIGCVATVLVASMGQVGYKNLTVKRYTPSFESGFETSAEYTYRTDDRMNFWFDFSGIAGKYNPGEMDFDSYIYGVYCRFPVDTRIDNMDSLIRSMHSLGFTEYEDFLSYCRDKDLIEVIDGKEVVNTKKYSQEIKKYMINYNKKEEIEAELSGFRRD